REIPYGETRTYAQIAHIAAQRLGRRSMSARAVGQAIGRNPISILIPCHRVIGSDGQITGYAGGVDRKTALLKLEREHRRA
ncbi:MAG TPA: MGMT family protein, partial [Candidatus Ozemobacteraceae bacterium]|nr:MGMT family protein [Candidatus Ozemobacteraceae bacterium]